MKYVRKGNFKRKATKGARKTYKKTPVSGAVKSYVKRTIAKNIENKFYTNSAINQPITTPVQGATGVTAIVLVPALSQSLGQGGRVGNICKVKSARLDLIINLKDYAAVSNELRHPTMVRCILLRYRVTNTLALFSDAALFQSGSASLGCQGNMLDQILRVNKDLYQVYSDKTFSLSTPGQYAGQYADNLTGFNRRIKMNVGKHIKTLKYNDNQTAVENTNLYLVMIPSKGDGSNGGSVVTPIEYHFNYEIQYEDA